ncbi:MAG: hypothetical protein HKN70_00700 [Gammaproteobacteria bacterium]|nr:hypothetical protein [Gammaproteobacteria bacterium]
MMYRIRLTLMIGMVLICGVPLQAGPEDTAGASLQPMWSQADAPRSFYAAGKIHQVIAAGSHVWLIADHSPDSTDKGPWLVRTDSEGVMQASIPMHEIPGLDRTMHWSRIPLAATRSGGLGMLVYDQNKSPVLLEFDMAARLLRHNSLAHLPESTGGLLGLEFDGDHWLIVDSQKILRLDDELGVVNSWSTEHAEFIVAYTMDKPAHITIVLVQDDEQGYRWATRQLDSSSFRASAPTIIAQTAARHFLVDVFVPDSEHTVVVMPDIDNKGAGWQLITLSSTGKLASTAIQIPQHVRKAYQTRVFAEGSRVHFLSIDTRQAWHTVVNLDNTARLSSRMLKLPRAEYESVVTHVYGAHANNRLYAGTNYRMASGSQPIHAAALLLLQKSWHNSP